MASVSERLALIIDFKGDAAIKGLEGVAKKSESADEKTRGLSDKLTKMGATGLAASGVAAVGLSKLASSASDLNEVTNKAKVLFGDAYGEIDKFASSAAKNLGQSKTAALEAASTFAGLGRAAGLTGGDLSGFSTSLTTLASDLASFGNTSPEEAVQALGSALRGEAEPIRAYNVLLDDAKLKNRALQMGLIETTTGTLPPAIKVQAAYAEIMAQTSAAQGDFKNTSDGLANQQRILKAEIQDLAAGIGAGLLPMFTGAIHAATGLVGKFNELSPSTQSLIGSLAGIGVASGGAVSAVALIAGQLLKLKDRFTDGNGQMNTFGKVAIGAGAGVAVLSAAVAIMQAKSDRAQKSMDTLEHKMAETGTTAETAGKQLLFEYVRSHQYAQGVLDRTGLTIDDLAEALRGEGAARDKVVGALKAEMAANTGASTAEAARFLAARELFNALNDNIGAVDKYTDKTKLSNLAAGDAAKTAGETVKGLSEQRRYLLDNADATDEYTKAVEQEKRVQENAERATQELTKALDDQKKKNDDLYKSFLDAWSGQNIDLPKAIDDVKTALLDYYDASKEAEDATKKYGAESEEAQRAQLKFAEAGRNGYEAIQAVARVALETEAARRGISVDALDAAEKVSIQKQALDDLKKTTPEYAGAIDQVASSMDGVANAMDTAASKTEDAARRIDTALKNLADQVAGHFSRISISATSGLTMLTGVADRMEGVVSDIAAYEKRNGPGWRT